MPDFLLQNPFTIALGAVAFIASILYIREYNLRNKFKKEGEIIWETLQSSVKKSQDIVGTTELEGVKLLSDTRFKTRQMEETYNAKLTEVTNQFISFLKDLQNKSVETQDLSRKSTEQRINQVFERLETRLSDFLLKTEQSTTSSIELELKSARQLIETYKQEQLKLIDENILAMMEQTLGLVLNKKLSLKEQLDLIYEALEKAKVEKFIA